MKKSILVCAVLLLSASGHAECPSADLSGDCFVGLGDLAIMASQWESEPDMAGFSIMASQWMTEGVPADPENLVWVYIDDPGVDEDGDGIPDHEGFTGEMSKYETTNAQFCQFLNSALDDGLITVDSNSVYATSDTNLLEPYFDTYAADSHSQITYSGGIFSVRSRKDIDDNEISMSNHPVVEVSWYGATAFCNYYGYRLPTEWEWQAVADYDGSYTYGCGTTISQSKANYYLGNGNYCNPLDLSSHPYTSPVDHFSSYGYGLNDMAGNVWEWTDSIYSGSDRVLRGGGWNYGGYNCAVSYRGSIYPSLTRYGMGFRVCR